VRVASGWSMHGRRETIQRAGKWPVRSKTAKTLRHYEKKERCGRPRSIAGPLCLRLRAFARDSAADELSSIWRGARLVDEKPALPTLQPLLSEDRNGRRSHCVALCSLCGELPGVTQAPSDVSKSISRSPDGTISLRSDTARLHGPPGAQHHCQKCNACWPARKATYDRRIGEVAPTGGNFERDAAEARAETVSRS
jgi:hypothetical protein